MKNMKRVQYHLRVNAEGHSEKHNGSNYISLLLLTLKENGHLFTPPRITMILVRHK